MSAPNWTPDAPLYLHAAFHDGEECSAQPTRISSLRGNSDNVKDNQGQGPLGTVCTQLPSHHITIAIDDQPISSDFMSANVLSICPANQRMSQGAEARGWHLYKLLLEEQLHNLFEDGQEP